MISAMTAGSLPVIAGISAMTVTICTGTGMTWPVIAGIVTNR